MRKSQLPVSQTGVVVSVAGGARLFPKESLTNPSRYPTDGSLLKAVPNSEEGTGIILSRRGVVLLWSIKTERA